MLNLLKNINPILNPSQVGYLIFFVTNVCNFRCDFCFYNSEIVKGEKPDQLSLDEIDKFSKKLGSLVQLSLTGGEAYLRKDFTELTDILIKNTKPMYVSTPTNGSLPDRIYDHYNYLLPKYPNTYFRNVFSIEGIDEVHDNLRGVKNSFKKIIKSYEKLLLLKEKYKNLVVDSNSVFTKNSEDTLLNTVKYLRKNFNFDNISVTYARGSIPDEKLKSKSHDKYKEINDLIQSFERNKEGRKLSNLLRGVNTISRNNIMKVAFEDKFVNPCVASKKLIILQETGDVYPCEILNKKIGNIKDYDYDIKKLLATKKNEEMKKWIKQTKCKCTFECATSASVVWNYSNIPKILKYTLKSYIRDK